MAPAGERIHLQYTPPSYSTEERLEGLAGDKRLILAETLDGVYGPGKPIAAMKHGKTYMRTAFNCSASAS